MVAPRPRWWPLGTRPAAATTAIPTTVPATAWIGDSIAAPGNPLSSQHNSTLRSPLTLAPRQDDYNSGSCCCLMAVVGGFLTELLLLLRPPPLLLLLLLLGHTTSFLGENKRLLLQTNRERQVGDHQPSNESTLLAVAEPQRKLPPNWPKRCDERPDILSQNRRVTGPAIGSAIPRSTLTRPVSGQLCSGKRRPIVTVIAVLLMLRVTCTSGSELWPFHQSLTGKRVTNPTSREQLRRYYLINIIFRVTTIESSCIASSWWHYN